MSPCVFDGLTVVDLSVGMAGPIAGMIMADNGAQVTKVELPEGDHSRREPGFLMWNRGKRSVVLDERDEAGTNAIRALIQQSDVVITNPGSGVCDRLSIDKSRICFETPQLVYCEISGFGPLTDLEALGDCEGVVAAKIGRMGDGYGVGRRARQRPAYISSPVNSFAAAMLAVQGITASLVSRLADGQGRPVLTSLLEGAMALTMSLDPAPAAEANGPDGAPTAGARAAAVSRRGVELAFMRVECSDRRYIQMCARQEKHFRNWMSALGLDALIKEQRFAAAPMHFDSTDDADELEHCIRASMLQKTQSEWIGLFIETIDVGGDPFLTFDEFLSHPQLIENGRVVTLSDRRHGPARQVGPLVLMSETPARIIFSAPELGEHQGSLEKGSPAAPPDTAVSPRRAAGETRVLPLDGVTIVELAYFLAAPVGTALLAELGARIIKVEPLTGDPYRASGSTAMHIMSGKDSIAVDLQHPRGRAVMTRLLERANGFVHGLRLGAVDRLGLNYEQVREINPKLIYLYAGSYGSRGPQAHRAAFHSTPNALSGGGILQAGSGNPPVDDTYPDPCSGLAAGVALALGLLAQARFGMGQYLETTMLTSTGYVHSNRLVEFADRSPLPVVDSEQLGLGSLYRLYPCSDGWLFLSVHDESDWSALTAIVDREDLGRHPSFCDAAARIRNDGALGQELARSLTSRSAATWERELVTAGVTSAEVSPSFMEFIATHGLASKSDAIDPGMPQWRLPRKVRFGERYEPTADAAALGQHTEQLLGEVGYSSAEIDDLLAANVVRGRQVEP